jgi:hypothetical protein
MSQSQKAEDKSKDEIIKELQERITVLENTLKQNQEIILALRDAFEKQQQAQMQQSQKSLDPSLIGSIIGLLRGGDKQDPLAAALGDAIKQMITAQAEAVTLQNKVMALQLRKMLNKLVKETAEVLEVEESGRPEKTGVTESKKTKKKEEIKIE